MSAVGPSAQAAEPATGPRDLFHAAGIDQSQFDRLVDGRPWDSGEEEILLKILFRVHRSFPPATLQRWCRGRVDVGRLSDAADDLRGEIFRLRGRVTAVRACLVDPEAAVRFGLESYYRCEMTLDDDRRPVVLLARTVPQRWKLDEPIDEPAGAMGFFLKLAGDDAAHPLPVFAVERVAWYPSTALGRLGMDVGLLDEVRPGRLSGRDRECFYQMLAAVGRAKPGALARQSRELLAESGQQRVSVVPLFNQPQTQLGRLVTLTGTTRHVIKVRVDDEDIVQRLGIDHYYQLALFTEDSQSNPLIFCVRSLPRGMPQGEGSGFAERVTVSGFFLKRWTYRVPAQQRASGGETERQLAPLLIGRRPVWHAPEPPSRNSLYGAVGGGLFILAILVVWLVVWRVGRNDRKFDARIRADRLEINESLSPEQPDAD